MRTHYLALVGLAFIVPAVPAFAQDAASAVAAQRSDMIRSDQTTLHTDTVDYWQTHGGEVTRLVANYRKQTEPHRLNALQIAEQAKTATFPAGTGARIRDALDSDLTLMYNSLPVSKAEWDSMRKQWLVPVGNLTDQQWAAQRAAWFTARDAWIDKRLQTARIRQ